MPPTTLSGCGAEVADLSSAANPLCAAKAGLKDGSLEIWNGPIMDNTGKQILAKDAVADDKFLGGLNSFYLLEDRPDVYCLPSNPQLPVSKLAPSSLLSRQVACRVVPEPAKKSRMIASGRSPIATRSVSATAWSDLGKGKSEPGTKSLSSTLPYSPER